MFAKSRVSELCFSSTTGLLAAAVPAKAATAATAATATPTLRTTVCIAPPSSRRPHLGAAVQQPKPRRRRRKPGRTLESRCGCARGDQVCIRPGTSKSRFSGLGRTDETGQLGGGSSFDRSEGWNAGLLPGPLSAVGGAGGAEGAWHVRRD